MKRIRTLAALSLSLSLLILVLFSCSSGKKKELALIKKIENDINVSMNLKFDDKKVNDYADACKKFVNSYPGDTICPSLLMKAGRLVMNMPEPAKSDEAVVFFERVVTEYPSSKEAPVALFMKGFYLENNMKNISKAGEAYKEFLKKFPDHPLAKDAKTSVENLGKPLEQIIKEFEEKQKDTSKVITKK